MQMHFCSSARASGVDLFELDDMMVGIPTREKADGNRFGEEELSPSELTLILPDPVGTIFPWAFPLLQESRSCLGAKPSMGSDAQSLFLPHHKNYDQDSKSDRY